MQDHDEVTGVLKRNILAKAAVANAIRENKQLGLSNAEPPTEEEIAEEIVALDFSRWKSVPVA